MVQVNYPGFKLNALVVFLLKAEISTDIIKSKLRNSLEINLAARNFLSVPL